MNGDTSPWTGTDRAPFRTPLNFDRSAATNRLWIRWNKGGNVWIRAVRKGCGGTYTLSSDVWSGGFVTLAPMFNQTLHAVAHKEMSISESSPEFMSKSFEIPVPAMVSPEREITSSDGGTMGFEVPLVCLSSSSVSCLTWRISWKLFNAARDTSALGHSADDSMCSKRRDHALGKSPGKQDNLWL